MGGVWGLGVWLMSIAEYVVIVVQIRMGGVGGSGVCLMSVAEYVVIYLLRSLSLSLSLSLSNTFTT